MMHFQSLLIPRLTLVFLFTSLNLSILLALHQSADLAVADSPQTSPPQTASLYSKQGVVEYRTAESSNWLTAEVNHVFNSGDLVRTGPASRAALMLADGILVRLNQNSRFSVEGATGTSAQTLNVALGDAYFFSRKSKEFPTIKTSQVSAAIRGTEFTVHASTSQSIISVLAGSVIATNKFGEVSLTGGDESIIETGKAPRKALMINPEKSVQWALYYAAPVEAVDLSDLTRAANAKQLTGIYKLEKHELVAAASIFTGSSTRDRLAQALIAKLRGQGGLALEILREPALASSPSATLLRASLLLERGQSVEAQALHSAIESTVVKSASSSPGDLLLLRTQQGMIALAQNQLPQAREKVKNALELAQNSATAAVAASYVFQADADLDAAKAVIRSALNHYPDNPTLKLRRAELSLGDGDSLSALLDAESVLAGEARDAYAHSIAGFAKLARNDRLGAAAAFDQAILLSSGDGLPFLGKGLTLIRGGNLTDGRLAIQQAVHSEPNRALYRSYLGKALFEEEKNTLADEEYARAITLDPNDPTPYLYRSYQRSSENRPVEALADIEKSIELNDNRGVYRSQLLLDQDSAVRSSSLATLYGQLGFDQVSRIEAIKSLSKDYGNYSAHLLLSESYDTVDELTQAQISETFIARLLSPVNFNIVRPNAAGTVTSNEYTALFDGDITRTSVGLDAGTRKNLVAPRTQIAGTDGLWGYNMSYDYTYADGFRDNDSQNEHEISGTLQYQITPEDTLLFDTSFQTLDNGDEAIGFNPRENDPGEELSLNDYFARVGFSHRFDPQSQLIGQVITNKSRLGIATNPLNRGFLIYPVNNGEILEGTGFATAVDQRIRFQSQGVRGDLQYISKGSLLSHVTGAGALDSTQNLSDSATFLEEASLIGNDVRSRVQNTESSLRAYNYTTLHVTPELDLQGGVSFSRLHLSAAPLSPPFSDDIEVMTVWDSKVGLVYSPTGSTTIRGAYFESVGNAGIRELELIEPTVFSGFNQTFFDIFPGTRSRNFAVGIDQKLPTRTYVGIEALHRDVRKITPLTASALLVDASSGALLGDEFVFEDGDTFSDENTGRAYAYQVISDQVTATVDYLWSQQMDHSDGSDVLTNRVQLGTQYTDPSGFIALVRSTWRGQSLSGFDEEEVASMDGWRDFWLVDAGVGYRLPNRSGQFNLVFTNIFARNFQYIQSGLEPEVLPGAGVIASFSYNF